MPRSKNSPHQEVESEGWPLTKPRPVYRTGQITSDRKKKKRDEKIEGKLRVCVRERDRLSGIKSLEWHERALHFVVSGVGDECQLSKYMQTCQELQSFAGTVES